MKIFPYLKTRAVVLSVLVFSSVQIAVAQEVVSASTVKSAPAALPKVTQIDASGLRKLIKPNGKPLLINVWATWCPPCRDEFPDLVKLDNEYRGKVDIITISMDDLADINTYVPQFLASMKAKMPAYLLHTPDEDASIKVLANDWNGNLPLTVIYNAAGGTAYVRKGKIRYDVVNVEINKLLSPPPEK